MYNPSTGQSIKVCTDLATVRLWHVASRPPQVGLKVDITKIMCKINEVKEEINIKLNERVRDLQNQLLGKSVIFGGKKLRLITADMLRDEKRP